MQLRFKRVTVRPVIRPPAMLAKQLLFLRPMCFVLFLSLTYILSLSLPIPLRLYTLYTGLTHHYRFLTFGRSGAQRPNVKNLKWFVKPVWRWTLRTAAILNSWRWKGSDTLARQGWRDVYCLTWLLISCYVTAHFVFKPDMRHRPRSKTRNSFGDRRICDSKRPERNV